MLNSIFKKKASWLFFIFSLLGTMLAVSAKNMFTVWLGFELNLFSITPVLLMEKNSKSAANVFYYFLFQVFGTILFFFGLVSDMSNLISLVGLYVKAGVFPFLFVYPYVFCSLSWVSLFILGTVQKIGLFFVFRYVVDMNSVYTELFVLLSLTVAVLIIYFQNLSIKRFWGWSSVIKTSVLIFLCSSSFLSFFIYLMLYSASSYLALAMMAEEGHFGTDSCFGLCKPNKSFGTFVLFTLSGFPPFLVFIPKVMFLSNLSGVWYWGSLFIVIHLMYILTLVFLDLFTNIVAYSKILRNGKWSIGGSIKIYFCFIFFFFLVCVV